MANNTYVGNKNPTRAEARESGLGFGVTPSHKFTHKGGGEVMSVGEPRKVYFYVNKHNHIWGCWYENEPDECFRDEPIDARTLEGVKIIEVERAEDGTPIFYGELESNITEGEQ
jgi:hypothetical protein